MKYIIICLALMLSACGDATWVDCLDGCSSVKSVVVVGPKGDTGVPGMDGAMGPVGPAATPAPMSSIEAIVADENEYRVSIGQNPLTKGLVCTLYTVPSGTAAIAGASLTTVASYTYKGVFDQPNSPANDGLNILPPALRSVYKSWFVVRCTGKIVIETSDVYGFDLSSDDGSVLYVAGSKIIDNDGNHGVTTKSGFKSLRKGVHDFRLDYMQGPAGHQALILSSLGSVVSSSILWH